MKQLARLSKVRLVINNSESFTVQSLYESCLLPCLSNDAVTLTYLFRFRQHTIFLLVSHPNYFGWHAVCRLQPPLSGRPLQLPLIQACHYGNRPRAVL